MTEYAPEAPDSGTKDAKVVRVKLGTGREWSAPVDIVRAMLESMSRENPDFVGRHLQGALMGEMPKGRRARRNGDGGAE